MPAFDEVADRVWVARYAWMDVNVTAIGSERGLVVVDTHGSAAAGQQVLADLDRLGAGPITQVINTHWHWDHTFGNGVFREAVRDVPIYAHEQAAVWLAEQGDRMKQRFAETPDHPHSAEVAATEIVLPDHTFTDSYALDMGDRLLELMFPGRGHTCGDIVLRVPDADLMIAGDLIEESAQPWIGMDSWPLEWPVSLDVVVGLLTDQTVVIPGHGVAVDRRFVARQRDELAQIASAVRALAGHGLTADQAVAEGEWPWEADDRIRNALIRGFEALSLPAPVESRPRS